MGIRTSDNGLPPVSTKERSSTKLKYQKTVFAEIKTKGTVNRRKYHMVIGHLCFGGCEILYLRGDVIRRATERCGCDAIQNSLLTHAKICQLTVTLCIQQNVV